jgi:NAD kinase
VIRTPEQLAFEGGELMYQVTIGSLRFYVGVNEAEKNEAVEFFMNQLEGAKENYLRLEVKVIQ